MAANSLGWALMVVGFFLATAGAILIWTGQQIVADPAKLVPPSVSAAVNEPAPVLEVRQERLLRRVWEIQKQFNVEYLVLGLSGRVTIDDRPTPGIDLKVEILGGAPAPQREVDSGFEQLIDSMPTAYLRRLDRENPTKYGTQFGRFVIVAVSDAGIRYLRNSN